MKMFFKIYTKNFFLSFNNLFFCFILPITFCTVTYAVWRAIGILDPITVLPGMSLFSFATTSIIILPMFLFKFRESGMLIRIKTAGKENKQYMLSLVIFFFVLSFVSYFFNLVITSSLLLWNSEVTHMWRSADYLGLLFTIFLASVLSLSLGFFIGTVVKRLAIIQICTCTIIFLIMLTSFWVFPAALFSSLYYYQVPVLYITYLSPFRYLTMAASESWLQSDWNNFLQTNIFRFDTVYYSAMNATMSAEVRLTPICYSYDQILNILIPIATSLILIYAFSYFRTSQINQRRAI
ncbi:MAG: hypothetical protein LBM76_03265 [Mycoplasmataceae bacterium]|jgi:hypothetical protein|nr:hypothetical protein [Mycoplasmataceae bacterium]